MGWFRDHSLVVSMIVFLGSSIVSLLVLGYIGLLTGLAFVSGRLTVAFLFDLAPYLGVLIIVSILTVVSGLSLGWAALRRLSLPRGGRLHSVVERLEKQNSMLATLGISSFLALPKQSDDEQVETLKQRYVDGAIDESEFERELERLTTPESSKDASTASARESRNTERERD